MSHLSELLPFVFLGIVIGMFLPAGNISTRSGVRPLSAPYMGDSLRSPSFVAGFMANFLNLINHVLVTLQGAAINDPRRIFSSAESATTGAPARPYDILQSEAQALGWTGLNRASFDIISDLEGSLDAQPFDPVYVHFYITAFVFTIVSRPNAITPGARASITDYLVYDARDLFNDEYLPFNPSDNLIVADFIIATSNQISPVAIAMLHLAWSDPEAAQIVRSFSKSPSWDRYNHQLSGSLSVRQIAHSAHCQSPIWPSEIPGSLTDVEVEFIAALFAAAIFAFHYGSFAAMK